MTDYFKWPRDDMGTPTPVSLITGEIGYIDRFRIFVTRRSYTAAAHQLPDWAMRVARRVA